MSVLVIHTRCIAGQDPWGPHMDHVPVAACDTSSKYSIHRGVRHVPRNSTSSFFSFFLARTIFLRLFHSFLGSSSKHITNAQSQCKWACSHNNEEMTNINTTHNNIVSIQTQQYISKIEFSSLNHTF